MKSKVRKLVLIGVGSIAVSLLAGALCGWSAKPSEPQLSLAQLEILMIDRNSAHKNIEWIRWHTFDDGAYADVMVSNEKGPGTEYRVSIPPIFLDAVERDASKKGIMQTAACTFGRKRSSEQR